MLDKERKTIERLERTSIGEGLIPPEGLLSDLISFLNRTKTGRGKRIVAILEKMLELEEMTKPIPPEEPMIAAVEWKRTDPNKYQIHWEIEKRSAMLQWELSKYRFTPRAVVAMGSGGKGSSEWATWWHVDFSDREKHLRMVASEALVLILKLTQIGYLTRLRRCVRCQKWLYAHSRHKVFCSMECQQKQYTHSEEFRAKRRVYMRGYYRKNYS